MVRVMYNRALQKAIDHNPGIPTRRAQRIALDAVLNTMEDLPCDSHGGTPYDPPELVAIYREVLASVEEKRERKRKEARRGNVARTAVAVPPGTEYYKDPECRPLSFF